MAETNNRIDIDKILNNPDAESDGLAQARIITEFMQAAGQSEAAARRVLKAWADKHALIGDKDIDLLLLTYKPGKACPQEFNYNPRTHCISADLSVKRKSKILIDDGENRTKSQRLMDIIEEYFEFVIDSETSKVFAVCDTGVQYGEVHGSVMTVDIEQLPQLLAGIYYVMHDDMVSDTTARNAVNVVKSLAESTADTEHLGVRIVYKNGKIYYDPCGSEWKIIEIDENGWRYVLHEKPMFKRYPHMREQITPTPVQDTLPEYNMFKIFRYVPITDRDEQMLFICTIGTYMIPHIPKPILMLHGTAGSGKTTTLRILRRLIDPSVLDVISFPQDDRDLLLMLSQNYFTPFDNVSGLSKERSDILCRAVTGAATGKRQLYTDDRLHILSAKRCIAINGINIAGYEPDFQDRVISFQLERIPEGERQPEDILMQQFEKDVVDIFSGMLSATSKAMAIVQDVRKELRDLPRMADFLIWGEAFARVLGYDNGEFTDAYLSRARSQLETTIEADPVGILLKTLAEKHYGTCWEGTPTALLAEIHELAEEAGVDRRLLPRAPHALMRRINILKPGLQAAGIMVNATRTGIRGRVVRVAAITNRAEYVEDSSQEELVNRIIRAAKMRPTREDDLVEKVLEEYGARKFDESLRVRCREAIRMLLQEGKLVRLPDGSISA